MALYYFVGGPTKGNTDEFFRRLAELGGVPERWKLYPHAGSDGRALHVVEADSEQDIVDHLHNFAGIYERGKIIEVVKGP